MYQVDNYDKNWQNFPISNPNPNLNNVNAHIFGEKSLIFTEIIIQKWKYRHVPGRQLCPKLTKFAQQQSQTRSPHYQYTHQVWWKSIDIYSRYHLEMKIQMCGRQITLPSILPVISKLLVTHVHESLMTFKVINCYIQHNLVPDPILPVSQHCF